MNHEPVPVVHDVTNLLHYCSADSFEENKIWGYENMLAVLTRDKRPRPIIGSLHSMASIAYLYEKSKCRNSYPEVFIEKGVLKISIKFTREHP